MRIELNGKPVEGEGIRDEPPPAYHVLKRLVGHQVGRVEIVSPGDGVSERFEVTVGPHRLSVAVRLL